MTGASSHCPMSRSMYGRMISLRIAGPPWLVRSDRGHIGATRRRLERPGRVQWTGSSGAVSVVGWLVASKRATSHSALPWPVRQLAGAIPSAEMLTPVGIRPPKAVRAMAVQAGDSLFHQASESWAGGDEKALEASTAPTTS